jgi:hypothetical protein
MLLGRFAIHDIKMLLGKHRERLGGYPAGVCFVPCEQSLCDFNVSLRGPNEVDQPGILDVANEQKREQGLHYLR